MDTDTAGVRDGLRQRLQAALGDAYTLERELGGGGMSRVFLADARSSVVEVIESRPARRISASD